MSLTSKSKKKKVIELDERNCTYSIQCITEWKTMKSWKGNK